MSIGRPVADCRHINRLEIVDTGRRRRWSAAEKLRIVEESFSGPRLAVMELDLTGAPVVVFRHASDGRVNLVYRRPDGNVGWIDPPGNPN